MLFMSHFNHKYTFNKPVKCHVSCKLVHPLSSCVFWRKDRQAQREGWEGGRKGGRERERESGREGERERDRLTDKTKFIGSLLQPSSWTHRKWDIFTANFRYTTTNFSISILFPVNKIQLHLNDLLNTWIKTKIKILILTHTRVLLLILQ